MENVNLYKKISLEIIEAINNDNVDILNELFDKRQTILNQEKDKEKLKEELIKYGILDIDNNIKVLLSNSIDKIKDEIKEHRRSIHVNNSYIKNNKENLNIFNKKV
nr:flagellar protein FliT [uncultured Romboutsia sp.]